MNVSQKKNIYITVALILLFIVTVQALFFNKILTPRYLSDIELKINGLVLLSEPVSMQQLLSINDKWILLIHNDEQQQAVSKLTDSLPKKIAEKTDVIENSVNYGELDQAHIFVANTKHNIIATIKPPFDINKMKLTYASVFTHR